MQRYDEGVGCGQFTKNGVPGDNVSGFGYGRCTDECREANTEDAYYMLWGVDDPEMAGYAGAGKLHLVI